MHFLLPLILAAQSPLFAHDLESTQLQDRVQPPSGFVRVKLKQGSFGAFLRTLPLKKAGAAVRAFDGRLIDAPALAVIDIDVGKSDLQQCADSVIRMHAEYLLANDKSKSISYKFTSGDEYSFADHLLGIRPVIGKKVRFEKRAKPIDAKYCSPNAHASRQSTCRKSFKRYLKTVFTYAGTLSISRDAKRVKKLEPGDFIVKGGSPGHALLVLDVAESNTGERLLLLGQGFMPAQSFHVVRGPREGWFLDSPSIQTPSWPAPFSPKDYRRF